MFKFFFFFLLVPLVTHGQELVECSSNVTSRNHPPEGNLHVYCEGPQYEGFRATVRKSDIKQIKVSVTDSHTGQTKQLTFSISPEELAESLDARRTGDGYIRFRTNNLSSLAKKHGIQDPVTFESLLLSPEIYVGHKRGRHQLSKLLEKYKTEVCTYSEPPTIIYIGRNTFCVGKANCTIGGNRINKMSVCMTEQRRCPDAGQCVKRDKENGYTRNW